MYASSSSSSSSSSSPPTKVIYLTSVEGQELLEQIKKKKGGLYQPILHSIFAKQSTPAGCGMQSCALLLSSNQIGKRFNNSKSSTAFPAINPSSTASSSSSAAADLARRPPYTELDMYELKQTLAVTNRGAISGRGMTLSHVASVLESHGCSVREVHAGDATPHRFRSDVVEALSASDSTSGVVVNFTRSRLVTEERWSHHSPLAAYHARTDRVLVLDTAVGKSDFWVTVDDLFAAMNTVDATSKVSRGYVVASK